MNSEQMAPLIAAVVTLVQLTKWALGAGIGGEWANRFGPLIVLLVSLLGTLLFQWSAIGDLTRQMVWPLFSAWIIVLTSAAGVYGFVRDSPSTLTALTKKPPKRRRSD